MLNSKKKGNRELTSKVEKAVDKSLVIMSRHAIVFFLSLYYSLPL